MVLFNSPNQFLFDHCNYYEPLSESNINYICSLASNIKSNKGETEITLKDPSINTDYRKSNIKWITNDNSTNILFTQLESLIKSANTEYYNFDISFSDDAIQYTEYYGTDKGKYDWHIDQINPYPYRRKLSLIIQLSNPSEYEGGELQIKTYNLENKVITIPKQKGLITIFPSYLLHRVTPVTKGTRKSLVWWVGGCPFR